MGMFLFTPDKILLGRTTLESKLELFLFFKYRVLRTRE
jgi:hypothetical protein